MSTTTKNCEECSNHRAVLGNELAYAISLLVAYVF